MSSDGCDGLRVSRQGSRSDLVDHDLNCRRWSASHAIFYKLASGEIPVGTANRLTIESVGKIPSGRFQRTCGRR